MFLNVWDVCFEISVVSAHVNLNGLSVHMKNRKMENRPVHWFGLTDLNKTNTVNVLKLRTLKNNYFSAVRNFRNYLYEKCQCSKF